MTTKLPSETSFGRRINIDKIKTELFKYLSTSDVTTLSYEYVTDSKLRLAFITGRNELERELPMFEHPILIEGVRHGNCLAIDLRKYVRIQDTTSIPRTLAEITKDGGHLMFSVLRGLYTADYINGNYGILSPAIKNLTVAYSMFIANTLGSVVTLSYPEVIQVEIAAALYFTIISSDSDDMSYLKEIAAARVSTSKMTGMLSKTVVDKAYRDIPLEDLYDNFGKSIDLLFGIVKNILTDDKSDLMNSEVLFNNIANMWFGPGNAETMVMSLEHVPTWAALLYSAVTDNTYKKSRVSTIFDKYSKNIKPADYAKAVALYIKSKQVI